MMGKLTRGQRRAPIGENFEEPAMSRWPRVIYRWLSVASLAFLAFVPIVARCFGGALFGLVALLPASLFFDVVAQTIDQPSSFRWGIVLILILAGGLTYFLALLALRVFTGRGRKSDGGLLPPWATLGAIHMLGVSAAIMVFFGIERGKALPVLGGIMYLVVAYGGLVTLRARRRNDE